MSETLFETVPPAKTPFETLVDTKGEQWKDPDMIAKGYLAAQDHILKVEAELTAAKAEAEKVTYLEGLLKEIEEAKSKPAVGEASSPNNNSAPEGTPAVPSAEDIKTLVDKTLSERESSQTAAQNIAETQRLLTAEFGTEVSSTLEAKLSELGMSKEELDALATKSPTAVLTLMGKAPSKQTNTVPKSNVNTVGFQTEGGVRDFKYYQELRRKNKAQYYTPEVQNQLMKDRLELGEKFGLT